MTFALVATVGAATANSYVTVAEAATYFEHHPDGATWTALASDTVRGQYLILATSHIDMEPINGDKYTTGTTSGAPTQALRFPRTQDYDTAKYVPVEVKKATYEQALYLAQAGTGSTRQQLQAQGVTSISVGDASESYGSASSASKLGITPRQILLKAGLIKCAGRWSV
jgi:hypothetical protein